MLMINTTSSRKFAKLYESEELGQILITRKYEDKYIISVTYNYYGLDITIKIEFPDDEQGEDNSSEIFTNMTEGIAERIVNKSIAAMEEENI